MGERSQAKVEKNLMIFCNDMKAKILEAKAEYERANPDAVKKSTVRAFSRQLQCWFY